MATGEPGRQVCHHGDADDGVHDRGGGAHARGGQQRGTYIVDTGVLTVIVIGSVLLSLVFAGGLFLVQVAAEAKRVRDEAAKSKARRLRYVKGDKEVPAPPLPTEGGYHTFLSHVWGTGQDQMRIVKQRLLEMIPGLSVFLDVDDLEDISDLQGYIERTQTILIYCSQGYFQSKNCMIEIRSTVSKGKPIIPVLDPDATRGGLTREQIREQLVESDGKWDKWGFNTDGLGEAKGEELYGTLFSYEPVEWNRIGAFQDVTMRLLANRLLPSSGASPDTYIKGELVQQKVTVGPPKAGHEFHVFCSEHVAGGVEIMQQLSDDKKCEVLTTQSIEQLPLSDHFLVYLHGKTWTSGEASEKFAAEVRKAMDAGISILLVHEMIGVGGQEARFGCEFGDFFSSPPDGTPADLLNRGIYATIAVAMKGGAWREASMVLLAQAVAGKDEGAGGGKPASNAAMLAKARQQKQQSPDRRRSNTMRKRLSTIRRGLAPKADGEVTSPSAGASTPAQGRSPLSISRRTGRAAHAVSRAAGAASVSEVAVDIEGAADERGADDDDESAARSEAGALASIRVRKLRT